MRVFVYPNSRNTFNHLFISNEKIVLYTLLPVNDYTEPLDKISSVDELLDKDNYQDLRFSGSILSDSVKDMVFYCAGKQVLELSSFSNKHDVSCYTFLRNQDNTYPQVFNRYYESYDLKDTIHRMLLRLNSSFLLRVNVPFKDNSLLDESNTLLFNPGNLGHSFSGESVEVIEAESMDDFRHKTTDLATPKITINGPDEISSNGAEYIINVKWATGKSIEKDVELYLKTDEGYVSKTKVTTSNGIAKVKVIPLGLDTGDIIHLKVGFKFLSNLTQKGISVNVV